MQIDIITIFPKLFDQFSKFGIVNQAVKSNKVIINIHDLRDFAEGKHKQVDARPFGGGPGMVLMPEPLFKAVEYIKKKAKKPGIAKSHVIFLTPQGKTYTQAKAESLAKHEHIILICGRYEGIDQRVRDELVDEEISIGNYVLSGGETPAMIIADSIIRLIPGVIKNDEFNDSESFSDKSDRSKLDFPQYTRPSDYRGQKVPEVLLSGNHEQIRKWREQNRKKLNPDVQ